MLHRFPRRTAAVAAAVAAALTVSTPAMAAGRRPRLQSFTAHGLVVASTPNTLRVLTRQLRVGSRNLPADMVVTVERPRHRGRALTGRSLVGYTVTLNGRAAASGRALTFAANTEIAQPRPAEVFLGLVTAVTPTGLILQEASAAGGDDFGDETNTLTVDSSAAGISVDGGAGTLVEDEFAIVLGERDGDNVVAATVDAYTTPPDTRAGEISGVSGSTITLADEWSHDQNNDGDNNDSDTNGRDDRGRNTADRHRGQLSDDPTPDPGADQPTTIDLTDVPVVLNGGSTIAPSTLIAGEKVVVLGETDTTTNAFAPQIAFAFNHDDHRPATHHED